MTSEKRIDAVCIAIVAVTLVILVALMNGESLGITTIESETEGSDLFTENDGDGSWDTSDATTVTLTDDGATVSGNGAYVAGDTVTVAIGGRYVLIGSTSTIKLVVDTPGDDKVWICLDGVTMESGSGAAITVENAGKVFLTLADGSENAITASAAGNDASIDGAIYSRDDLTVNGTGSLSVTGGFAHGIVCNDDLVLAGGTVSVEAAVDGEVLITQTVPYAFSSLVASAPDMAVGDTVTVTVGD